MLSLLRAELTRFRARRGIALLLLATLAVVVFLAARTAWTTRPPSPGELATAAADAAFAAHDPQVQAQVSACEQHPVRFLGPGALPDQCAAALSPTVHSQLPRTPLSLRHELADSGPSLAILLAAVAVIAGATFAGADWQSGSLQTQLVARRRRSAVWAMKATAVVLWSAGYGLFCFGLYWVVLSAVAQARHIGGGDGLSVTTVHGIVTMGLRAGVLIAATGLGAFALTMLLRHTVATLGLLFAYAAGGQVLFTLLPVTGVSRWSVGVNLSGWLQRDFHYREQSIRCYSLDACDASHRLGNLDAGLFLGALLVVAVLVSLVSFSRRDI